MVVIKMAQLDSAISINFNDDNEVLNLARQISNGNWRADQILQTTGGINLAQQAPDKQIYYLQQVDLIHLNIT
jgi:uncharacterized caspase-like protein